MSTPRIAAAVLGLFALAFVVDTAQAVAPRVDPTPAAVVVDQPAEAPASYTPGRTLVLDFDDQPLNGTDAGLVTTPATVDEEPAPAVVEQQPAEAPEVAAVGEPTVEQPATAPAPAVVDEPIAGRPPVVADDALPEAPDSPLDTFDAPAAAPAQD